MEVNYNFKIISLNIFCRFYRMRLLRYHTLQQSTVTQQTPVELYSPTEPMDGGGGHHDPNRRESASTKTAITFNTRITTISVMGGKSNSNGTTTTATSISTNAGFKHSQVPYKFFLLITRGPLFFDLSGGCLHISRIADKKASIVFYTKNKKLVNICSNFQIFSSIFFAYQTFFFQKIFFCQFFPCQIFLPFKMFTIIFSNFFLWKIYSPPANDPPPPVLNRIHVSLIVCPR